MSNALVNPSEILSIYRQTLADAFEVLEEILFYFLGTASHSEINGPCPSQIPIVITLWELRQKINSVTFAGDVLQSWQQENDERQENSRIEKAADILTQKIGDFESRLSHIENYLQDSTGPGAENASLPELNNAVARLACRIEEVEQELNHRITLLSNQVATLFDFLDPTNAPNENAIDPEPINASGIGFVGLDLILKNAMEAPRATKND